MIDAAIVQEDTVVARAGEVWSAPVAMTPLPADPGPVTDDMPTWVWGYNDEGQPGGALGFSEWQSAIAPKYAWIRQVRPLVSGEETTPLVVVSMAADATSALSR